MKSKAPIALIGACLIFTALAGCNRTTVSELTDRDQRGESTDRGTHSHLARAVSLLERVEDYDEQRLIQQAHVYLSLWAEEQPVVEDWKPDPMLKLLPRDYKSFVHDGELATLRFHTHDVMVIREAIWMRDAAKWQQREARTRREALRDKYEEQKQLVVQLESTTNRDDAKLTAAKSRLASLEQHWMPPWLAELRDAPPDKNGDSVSGEDAVERLVTAMQLFDWVVRNIQLEDTTTKVEAKDASDEQAESEAAEEEMNKEESELAGRYLLAFQAMLYGKADADSRTRVFILMARQLGIDIVMLGIPQKDAEPKTWAAGVLVAGRLYLFDPVLGLPIPGPDGQGIATLQQVAETPDLLRQLDLPDIPYPINSSEVKETVALIDTSPGYLRQRQQLVEQKLSREQALILSVQPTELGRKLQGLPGIKRVGLWTAPYRAIAFNNQSPTTPYPEMFSTLKLPLFAARVRQLRGWTETGAADDELGAKTLYLRCRAPDSEIENVKVTEVPDGLLDAPKEVVERFKAEATSQQKELLRRTKTNATYWLGTIAVAEGEQASAVDYLEKRTLQSDGLAATRWKHGAAYNLARLHESKGNFEQAIKLLNESESAQRYGDRLLAKWLEGAIAEGRSLPMDVLRGPGDSP